MKETKLPGDKGLVLMSRAKHHAISAKLNKPFMFDTKPLIVQWVTRLLDRDFPGLGKLLLCSKKKSQEWVHGTVAGLQCI